MHVDALTESSTYLYKFISIVKFTIHIRCVHIYTFLSTRTMFAFKGVTRSQITVFTTLFKVHFLGVYCRESTYQSFKKPLLLCFNLLLLCLN